HLTAGIGDNSRNQPGDPVSPVLKTTKAGPTASAGRRGWAGREVSIQGCECPTLGFGADRAVLRISGGGDLASRIARSALHPPKTRRTILPAPPAVNSGFLTNPGLPS